MLKAAQLLDIPVYVTTQNKSKLGETVGELGSLVDELKGEVVQADKTAFSMCVPDVMEGLDRQCQTASQKAVEVIIVGIETHICITQTTLDLLSQGHKVYVLQDGVSSCNSGERGVALRRLQSEGAVVTTSESVLFELVGDAGGDVFRGLTKLVKETKESTRGSVQILCGDGGGGEGKEEGEGGGNGSKL